MTRRAATAARRRGAGYVGYLLRRVAWPSAAFKFGWGPSAPPVLQGVFAAAGELVGQKPDAAELRRLQLVPGEGVAAVAAGTARPEDVERLLHRAHAEGLTGLSRHFRQLVRLPDGSLRFSDLASVRKHRPGSVAFASARDLDRRDFNREFNSSLLTEASARAALEQLKAKVPDFGGGLTVGRIVSTDSGPGRWDVFNSSIVAPLVSGRRVLDLGSNNGSLPLMMARAGAREVVAVESNAEIADFARLNARILAWRDVTDYQIQIRTGDMRLFLTEDLGRFDVVTAFCSLYYLPEDDMARIIRKAAAMGAVVILQANDAIESGLPGTTLDLHRLLRDNGYLEIAVHTPGGFARPILVGHTAVGVMARERAAAAG